MEAEEGRIFVGADKKKGPSNKGLEGRNASQIYIMYHKRVRLHVTIYSTELRTARHIRLTVWVGSHLSPILPVMHIPLTMSQNISLERTAPALPI
jgi:hypothetical protein